jgi:hypothetical protein
VSDVTNDIASFAKLALSAVILVWVLADRHAHSLLLRDCDACGLFRYEMSKQVNGKCVEKCAPIWSLLMGYSCNTCAAPTAPNPTPAVSPAAPANGQQPSFGAPAAPVAPRAPSAPAPAASPVASAVVPTTTVSGLMTMWTSSPSAVQGSSCEYAQPASTAKGSSWLVPHVNALRYCAVSDALYKGGLGCGQCYRITYAGVGGTDPGKAGSDIIQVVDSGSAKEFDCFLDAFTAITGAVTGVFPIQYAPVSCTASPPIIVVLDGNNSYYVKVLLAGGTTSVKSASLQIGSTTYTLDRVSGATWKAALSGRTDQQVSFTILYTDGVTETVSRCFGGIWPVATGAQCSK